ncbi:MarR family winged helix-turn-helix transcriptional regulator [Streptomyces sp. NPDC058001]|uniref:MarR family winged helix-turn-helix transcriptional regulator n=1 Tax=Streptomyces sp. NPDC058001 TaxID=3346300 RepID=UPI0036E17079
MSEPDGDPAAELELAGRLRAAIQHLLPLMRGQTVHPDLTPSRLTALAVLEAESPLRISELASRMGVALSTTSRMVDLLVCAGWLDRQTDPVDQRASLVGLSDSGHTVLTSVRRENTSTLAREVALLSPELQRLLHDALPALEALGTRARRSRTANPRTVNTGTANTRTESPRTAGPRTADHS